MRFWYRPRGALAWLLAPLGFAYALGVSLWGLLFDLGLRKSVRVKAKVISVGNVVVGGAGKTPAVIVLARAAVKRGERVAVLSRGYGRRSRDVRSFDRKAMPPVELVGDEPRLIARKVDGATLWVGADRVALAQRAVAAGATTLVLDDGFQHRRLARDVDFVVMADVGNGLCLPAGPLREPAWAIRRATHTWSRHGPANVEVRHRIVRLRAPDGAMHPVDALKGRSVVLLTGVARPELVRASVEALGAEVEPAAFGDHHQFTPAELERTTSAANGRWVVTTEKDAERLPEGFAYVLEQEVEVLKDDTGLC